MGARAKITAFLWFDDQAEQARDFYLSVFTHARAGRTVHTAAPGGAGGQTVLTASFELEGMEFTALNGGPLFKFNEAVSFVVHCDSQAEIDQLWARLCAGGAPGRCGWLKDRFGVSWQVVPRALPEWLEGADAAGRARVMAAIMRMDKLDIAALRAAAEAP